MWKYVGATMSQNKTSKSVLKCYALFRNFVKHAFNDLKSEQLRQFLACCRKTMRVARCVGKSRVLVIPASQLEQLFLAT